MAPHVLVADDDAWILRMVATVLEKRGYSVETAVDGEDALHRALARTPDLLITDVMMPKMDGWSLVRQLRSHAELALLPVIFLSGGADVPNAVRAVKEGAIDFIEKPFDYRQVVVLVRECIARDSAARVARDAQRASAERLAQLTQREREVLDRVVGGKLNREIAEELAISVKTVEAHRAHLMEKLEVDSVAELVQAVLSAA